MNKNILNKILPHAIAILIFLVASVVFNSPALEGKILNQYDIFGWQGIAKSTIDYKVSHGYYPLWNATTFSGMPNYILYMSAGMENYPNFSGILRLWLPEPMAPFFSSCICFYILAFAFRLKPVIGILTGLAFAFSTYNVVNISVGHMGKVYAVAYMPLLLAGLVLVYNKKYWLGLVVTTLGVYLELAAYHLQINYYFFLAAILFTLPYTIQWIKNKDFKHIGVSLSIVTISAAVGLTSFALMFLVMRDYTKTTMRGGKNIEINGDKVTPAATKGLDTSYAFQYSFSKVEPLVMLMPGALGGSSRDRVDEDTKVIEKLTNEGIPDASAMQVAQSLPKYWGGLESSGGISYIGAIIFLFAILGFVIVDHPTKWGILAASLLGIFIAMGKHFLGFNLFLFNNLPLFNKFRSPSMCVSIPELLLPLMAGITMQKLFFDNGVEYLKTNFKKILYTFGGVIALLGILFFVMNYNSLLDQQILATDWDKSGTGKIGKLILSGLKEDRKGMFGGQILRTLGFIILILAPLWLYMKKYVNPAILLAILGVINFADLAAIDKTYLNEENYISKDESPFETTSKSAIDEQILKDTTLGYRVFNGGSDRFSASDYKTNMFHRSVGGYSAAKMRKYQDIIERYLSSMPNQQILNMLNVKYIIAPANQQGEQQSLYPVNTNYGAAWFVKNIKFVNDNVEEIQSLGSTNLKDTVVIQKTNGTNLQQPQWDSSASIKITRFTFDTLVYESNAATPQYAVFSEVHYPRGWNVYIDGKQVDHNNVNYILRGLPVPTGKHKIEFIFAPTIVKTGVTLTRLGYWLVFAITFGGLFMSYWQTRKQNIKPAAEKI